MCLTYRGIEPILEGYTDADMAGDLDERKSVSRFLLTFAGEAVLTVQIAEVCGLIYY